MYQLSVLFGVLSIFFLSVLGAPLPLGHPLSKRTNNGKGTYFYDGLGACGYSNSNSDPIVALSIELYGSGGSCGQWVTVTNTANQQSAYGMIRDRCQGCSKYDLDMSTGLFSKIGDLSTGVLNIDWDYMPQGWSPPSS